MFRHLDLKNPDFPDGLFIRAEFIEDGESLALGFAVTDGQNAWMSIVKNEQLDKLVVGSRLGSLDSFRSHTEKAFSYHPDESPNKPYVVDVKLSESKDDLELKWKIREQGFSKVVGSASLFKAASTREAIAKILSSVISGAKCAEYQCEKTQAKVDELDSMAIMLDEAVEMPGVKTQIIERAVELLNNAKRRIRGLGASTQGFQEAWELATQQPSTSR